MAIIKCKMCGGDLEIAEGISVAECEYCGSKQTIPNADNEKKLTMFARANKLRAQCEFDKAYGIYETIVSEYPEEAEAYWGLVLCKYGIEYVTDPASGKKIPTCHRSSFDSVMSDSNFEQTLENADMVARKVYRDEAKAIEELRKSILEVSGKEAPYDIFICYKETDETGGRTLDSVLAQDVYDALTEKGYRVFFSRISLEDKLGVEYEPYIFAALNSAKIMLAFGTDYEYYNAVWVKNEWSRFLQLMTKDKTKHLIPCYKGIDAYDIPQEFQRLQAQDMGKVGAVQDLLRGIEKLLPRKKSTPSFVQPASSPAGTLVKRGYIYLEDGEFKGAVNYFDRALDENPEESDAYLGKVMAALQVRNTWDLGSLGLELSAINDFQRALRYANDAQKEQLTQIQQRSYATVLVNQLQKVQTGQTACLNNLRAIAMSVEAQYSVPNLLKLQAAGVDSEKEDRVARLYMLPPYLTKDQVVQALKFDCTYSSVADSLVMKKAQAGDRLRALRVRFGPLAQGEVRTGIDASIAQVEAGYDAAIAKAQEDDRLAEQEIMARYEKYLQQPENVIALMEEAKQQRHEEYTQACALLEQKDYEAAQELFARTAQTQYEDSVHLLQRCEQLILDAREKARKDAQRQIEENARAQRQKYADTLAACRQKLSYIGQRLSQWGCRGAERQELLVEQKYLQDYLQNPAGGIPAFNAAEISKCDKAIQEKNKTIQSTQKAGIITLLIALFFVGGTALMIYTENSMLMVLEAACAIGFALISAGSFKNRAAAARERKALLNQWEDLQARQRIAQKYPNYLEAVYQEYIANRKP